MKRILSALFICFMFTSLSYAEQSAVTTAKQAIEQLKTMKSAKEQTKYLLTQANAFVKSKNFDQAIESAKYVLANLDPNSTDAKSIIEKATAEIKNMTQQKAGNLKKSLTNFGQGN